MLSSFFPANRLESYRTSTVQGPHRSGRPAPGRAAVSPRGHGAASARVAAGGALSPGAGVPAPARPRRPGGSPVRDGPSHRAQCQSNALRVGGGSDLPGRRRARKLSSSHRAGAAASAVVVGVGGGRVHHVPALPSRVGPTDRRQAGVAAHALRGVPRAGRRDPARRHHAPSHSRFPDPAADTGRRHAPDLRDDTAQLLPVGRDDRVAPPRPQCGGAAAPSIQAAGPAGCAHRARGDPPSAWRRSLVGDRPAGLRRLAAGGPLRPASVRPPAAPPRGRRLARGRAVDHPGQNRPRPHPAAARRRR